jgi:hypothetical protein
MTTLDLDALLQFVSLDDVEVSREELREVIKETKRRAAERGVTPTGFLEADAFDDIWTEVFMEGRRKAYLAARGVVDNAADVEDGPE